VEPGQKRLVKSDFDKRLRAAQELEVSGNVSEAQTLFEGILRDDPGHFGANLRLGILAAKSGQILLAVAHLQAVLEVDPVQFDALVWLAPILRNGGDLETAANLSRVAAAIRPEDPTGHSLVGLCLMSQSNPVLAELSFRRAVLLGPSEPLLHHQLAECLEMLARDAEAEAEYRRAVLLDPQQSASYVGLGKLLVAQGDTKGGALAYRQAYELEPKTARGLSSLGKALTAEGRMEEAAQVFQRIVAAVPKAAPPYFHLGTALRYLGRFQDAIVTFQRAIELQPRFAAAYSSLVHCRMMTPQDRPLAASMASLLEANAPSLDDRRHLEYALGKFHDDLGEYDVAMMHFDRANQIMRRLTRTQFDRNTHAAQFDLAIGLFPEPLTTPPQPEFERAVLIVGMIRSGTTLLEHIVSSHRDVTAAGELKFWLDHAKDALDPARGGLDLRGAARAGEQYGNLLRNISPAGLRVTDKMPLNYQYLGPIALACPGIRIIHCRRHPLDNCLSAYLTPYPAPVPYAHDRGDLAFYYVQYQRLMDEDLILNREAATRRVVEFLCLDWDEACLRPESNRRAVETPSSWQVRQPIYRTSIGRWKNYEPWLAELGSLRT
jgi:tetratricopeptide (TPR) repeat protein